MKKNFISIKIIKANYYFNITPLPNNTDINTNVNKNL